MSEETGLRIAEALEAIVLLQAHQIIMTPLPGPEESGRRRMRDSKRVAVKVAEEFSS